MPGLKFVFKTFADMPTTCQKSFHVQFARKLDSKKRRASKCIFTKPTEWESFFGKLHLLNLPSFKIKILSNRVVN
jgi:hypothetical protein